MGRVAFIPTKSTVVGTTLDPYPNAVVGTGFAFKTGGKGPVNAAVG